MLQKDTLENMLQKTLWKICFIKDTLEKMLQNRHSGKDASKKTLWKSSLKKKHSGKVAS
jgi:hypothetical protein